MSTADISTIQKSKMNKVEMVTQYSKEMVWALAFHGGAHVPGANLLSSLSVTLSPAALSPQDHRHLSLSETF